MHRANQEWGVECEINLGPQERSWTGEESGLGVGVEHILSIPTLSFYFDRSGIWSGLYVEARGSCASEACLSSLACLPLGTLN